jgi:hypothetical protein
MSTNKRVQGNVIIPAAGPAPAGYTNLVRKSMLEAAAKAPPSIVPGVSYAKAAAPKSTRRNRKSRRAAAMGGRRKGRKGTRRSHRKH